MNRSKLLINYFNKYGTCSDDDLNAIINALDLLDEDDKYVFNTANTLKKGSELFK